MDNLDDSENNAKISDSAYSNSCSNSQSRRSHSSKSTHSGSNSSGSSGYGGKPSTSSSSNNLSQPSKKEKDSKKKKQIQTEIVTPEVPEQTDVRPAEPVPVCAVPKEEIKDVVLTPAPTHAKSDNAAESMDISAPPSIVKEEVASTVSPPCHVTTNFVTSRPTSSYSTTGFSCVISMHDGIVMYTTSSLTTTLGFPKDMWIGRSFIDFVHPRDRNTFASQITSGLAVPKIVNGTQEKGQSPGNPASTMVCRIRRYRGLTTGFGVKDRVVTFMPFLLKFTFKNVSDEEGKVIYLVIQATPFFSAFRIPSEVVSKAVPFVMRHAANGNLEYIDPESVPYLGYLPQDVTDKDALQLYHPEDLDYLQQVYETIVKEGGVPRTKAYRMMAQNGDYLKLETEWSSFINPWSKRLEFVIGKHHIIEGPSNPDVFQSPDPEKAVAMSEEEKAKAQKYRENIIRTMNEVLTKPAEVAKQQMTKRCQDLASFMESLMEEQQPKVDEELRLDIQDPDHSYYERDSVMLGGISPHHDYNDSKSSTGTPLSYNQLNYNETLQRYFDSHIPYSCEDYNVGTRETLPQPMEPEPVASNCLSPLVQNSGDSIEHTSSCGSSAVNIGSPLVTLGDYQPPRLTESLLTKHNAEMEKELMKIQRENRTSSKGEREKTTNETRQKKKEHLARCNATFQPTISEVAPPTEHVYKKPHGVKRASKPVESEAGAHKHHCSSQRASRRKPSTSTMPVTAAAVSTTIREPTPSAQWTSSPVNNMNTFILGVGIPQQMSIVSPVPAMPGMFQMYYTPATSAAIPTTAEGNSQQETAVPTPQFQQPAMPCMMYGQPMYGPPIVYSPITPQVSYPVQHSVLGQSMQYTSTLNPLCLTNSNYEEACRVTFPPMSSGVRRTKKRLETKPTKNDHGSAESSSCSTNALKRDSSASQGSPKGNKSTVYSSDIRSASNSLSPKSTEAVPDSTPPRNPKVNTARAGNSEETVDRTDGESSYSSFYSSFFKTESGSAEESGDAKKFALGNMGKTSEMTKYDPQVKVARRKMEPPWMEQVCVTSELIYKYQITTKPMEDILKSDKQKICELSQPSLVNEQLGQLYLDLQLEGVAARLTLEEGITSSSSSGEEASTSSKIKHTRRKRKYSKLVMIYEENAPIPPPGDDAVSVSSRSMT
ncbi:period circadian protein isoform X2 [Manduca sexta]|uniref:period circadian protein isoform X2 n=1 Tax=Manduca sexta TaxID=7130 RepID=UPI00188DE708|nr:period circadian protein isoform X2 [Manduca sexta]